MYRKELLKKNEFKKIHGNIKELKSQIIRLYFSWLLLSSMRVKFLKKHKIFKEMGENVFWQPRILPVDAELKFIIMLLLPHMYDLLCMM